LRQQHQYSDGPFTATGPFFPWARLLAMRRDGCARPPCFFPVLYSQAAIANQLPRTATCRRSQSDAPEKHCCGAESVCACLRVMRHSITECTLTLRLGLKSTQSYNEPFNSEWARTTDFGLARRR